KSFAEKTVLEFQPGLTAIVGPNGCGKSNVFDAVRWVLGEQSVRELRGSSMEDVIFNGTDSKLPLGFAEVSLTFSNEKKILPIEYDEVTVTRRLFRSGESEYLINKNVCRLKDIVELFLGTGVGAEAYSLIQQGKVDLIVSAKPEDRRQIFDEAAGITKYKAKKKEAIGKLKETEDNLLRINDIVVEVKRQIGSIERQAKKAQRYKEDFERLKNFEVLIAHRQMARFDADMQELTAQSGALQAKEGSLAAELEEASRRLDHETALVEEIDGSINAVKARQMRLENDKDSFRRQIVLNEERLADLDTVCVRLEEDKAAALARCSTNQGKIEEIRLALAQLSENLAAVQVRLQAKKDALAVIVHAIGEAKFSIQNYENEQFHLNAQQARIKNQLTDNMKRVTECLARKDRLEHENNKVIGERAQVSQKAEALDAAMARSRSILSSLWADLEGKRARWTQLKSSLAVQETAADDLEKKKLFLLSQKDFVAKMQAQYQDTPDPVVEGKFISCVRPHEQQTGIIGKIKNIRIIAGEGGRELYEITCETKYVELDLRHMDERITILDAQWTQALEAKAQTAAAIDVGNTETDADLKHIQEEEKGFSVLEAQKNNIEQESGKIAGELDLIVTESAQVETDLGRLRAQESELSQTLEGITGQIRRCQDDVKAKTGWIAAQHKEREDMGLAIVQVEAETHFAADKRKAHEESCLVYTQSLDRDLTDIARFDRDAGQAKAKKAGLHEDIDRLNKDLDGLKGQEEALAVELEGLLVQKSERAGRLNGWRAQTRGIEDALVALKTDRHDHDMRQQEIRFNERALKDKLLQTYKINWDEGPDASVGAPVDQTSISEQEAAVEIENLKKRCDSYGAVNLVAIEEFEELKQRFEFLTKQQSDLLTAREALLQTITKINRTTRQMFGDTFTRVNEEFQVYFRMLFGGGQAQLVLQDPDNALECGIDIIARPPGKKLQNISLLSGGEKTLTAIALIFGVFKVNPSPFCVLDEIDAALDESNIGRFAYLLKDFVKIAQFIVITHNKKTMASADILYGITMQERGVSRIVSVKFDGSTALTTSGQKVQPVLVESKAGPKAGSRPEPQPACR
ncbi:MAG: AAA family ATPase, partial [Candidatus Omnitrophica bacterium]|nr:AAA family ATPase [Candidatus Omnitrophota bacterium]